MLVSARVLPAILLSALVLSACDIQVGDNGLNFDISQNRARDEWRRTYTLAAGGRLEITNLNGGIDVEPASGREVEVVIERTIRGGSDEEAQALLQALKMTEEVSPTLVKIEAQPGEGGRSEGFRRGVNLRYRVRVPQGLTLVFATSNGDVHFEDVSGTFQATTTNGGITAVDVTGGVKVKSVNGGIRIEMDAVTDDIEAVVTNGGVRIEVLRDTKATLEASAVNGGVTVDDSLGLVATEQSRTQVTGTLNGGGPKIVASTVNGGVRIEAVGQGD
jgi:hypothetical protein